MRTKFFVAFAFILGVSATGHAQKQIQLLATLVDATAAGDVAPSDFTVTEDGKPATVTKVEVIETKPKIQILIDNGTGMPSSSLADLRSGVRALLQGLPEGIEVTIVQTAPQPRFLERATTDRAKLLAAVDRITPDTGTGRFVESLHEASQRIDKDKSGRYTVVTIGTSSGDADVRERDVQGLMKNVQTSGATIHVILMSAMNTGSGGQMQGEVGQRVAQLSGGRFEKINAASRIPTLMQEMAAQIAQTLGGASRQVRITVDRPADASGDLGKLGLKAPNRVVTNVTLVPPN